MMSDVRSFPTELLGRVDPQLYRRLEQIYELIYQLQQQQTQAPTQVRQAVVSQLQLIGLLGPLGQSILGQSSAPDPQLQNLNNTSGTVTSITFGAAFTGGTISTSGTVNLIIGTANVLQKSDGAKLVNSKVLDDGNDITLNSSKKVYLGSRHVMTIDDTQGLVILDMTLLPTVDPGVPGALWTDGVGGLFVSP